MSTPQERAAWIFAKIAAKQILKDLMQEQEERNEGKKNENQQTETA